MHENRKTPYTHKTQRYMLKKIKKVNIYYCVILKGSYKLEIGRIFFTNRCVYTTDNELFASFIHKDMYSTYCKYIETKKNKMCGE